MGNLWLGLPCPLIALWANHWRNKRLTQSSRTAKMLETYRLSPSLLMMSWKKKLRLAERLHNKNLLTYQTSLFERQLIRFPWCEVIQSGCCSFVKRPLKWLIQAEKIGLRTYNFGIRSRFTNLPSKIFPQIVSFVKRHQLDNRPEITPRWQEVMRLTVFNLLIDFHVLYTVVSSEKRDYKKGCFYRSLLCPEQQSSL